MDLTLLSLSIKVFEFEFSLSFCSVFMVNVFSNYPCMYRTVVHVGKMLIKVTEEKAIQSSFFLTYFFVVVFTPLLHQ